MNFKIFSLILPFIYLNLKVHSISLITEGVNDSDDEIINVDFFGDEVKLIDILSDDENIPSSNVNINVEECLTEDCIESSKRILNNMDTSVDPCEDFYQFSCGGWVNEMNTKSIDNKYSSVFGEMDREIFNDIIEILQGENKVDNNLSKEQQEYDEKIFNKMKNVFDICMRYEKNSDSTNEMLKNFINKLNISENKEDLKNPKYLTNLIVKMEKNGIKTFIELSGFSQNAENNEELVIMKNNSILFSDYLSNHDIKIDSIYYEFVVKTINLIYGNDQNNDKMVESIIKFVEKLQEINDNSYNQTSEDNFEIIRQENEKGDDEVLAETTDTNNDIKVKLLNENYPFIDWVLYFNEMLEFYEMNDIPKDEIIVDNHLLNYLKELNDYINEVDVDTLITYFKWNIITSDLFDEVISEDFILLKEETNKRFQKILYELDDENDENDENNENDSQRILEKKYQKCIGNVVNLMPMAITRYFVKKNFNSDIKSESEQMLKYIEETMLERIPKVEWLDKETKNYAIEKVLKLKDKMCYSDDIMDIQKLYNNYNTMEIKDYLDIVISNSKLSLKKSDLMKEHNDPFELNAHYIPEKNMIEMNVGILAKPYYTSNEQDYLNYGAIGSVIAHELTHGFDITGKKYDADGFLKDWWTEDDNNEFDYFSQCFIDQYSLFTYNVRNKSYTVNGEETIGENIADNGGVARAYEAWKLSLLKNSDEASKRNKKLPGFSEYNLDQLFFISFAQIYCSIEVRPPHGDPHSPGSARVNGVVSNSEYFAKAFNCPPKSPMNPESKCLIW